MTTLAQLKSALDKDLEQTAKILNNYPWESREAYAFWLSQTYYYVCHSTRLLAASAARFDQTKNKLHLRFADHMKEERSHELLAQRDLEQLGYDISHFEEHVLTAAFYQCQYFLIEHRSPLALFGYILFLEGLAVRQGAHVYSNVLQLYGKKACRFWEVHAEEDPGHLEQAFQNLDSLSETELEEVQKSLAMSADLYQRILLQGMALQKKSEDGLFSKVG